jgi:hypothetical protein
MLKLFLYCRLFIYALLFAFAACIIMLLLAKHGYGQTILSVPYDKAVFAWDAPKDPPATGVGVTRWYLLNCGGPDVRVDAPATSIPVKAVVAAPGSYTCTIKAMNNFGPSLTVPFPAFEAGYAPADVGNAHIEIRP